MAVLIYAGGHEARASVNPILPDPVTGELLIQPGDAMTQENLQQLTVALSGGGGKRLLLPENVLVAEQGMVAWWLPSKRRPIFFSTGTAFDKKANATMPLHPALVLVGRPQSLTVYALAESKRPGPETQMYRAPYYNLFGHGAMCPGTAPLPDAPLARSIPIYERAFFESSFVHTNLGNSDMTRWQGGHNALWLAMINKKRTRFPSWSLIPLMQGEDLMTLDMAINMSTGRNL